MFIRKASATLALCLAGIATMGIGTASADVHPARIVGKYPTQEKCNEVGTAGQKAGKWNGYSCTSWNNGPYVLRVFD